MFPQLFLVGGDDGDFYHLATVVLQKVAAGRENRLRGRGGVWGKRGDESMWEEGEGESRQSFYYIDLILFLFFFFSFFFFVCLFVVVFCCCAEWRFGESKKASQWGVGVGGCSASSPLDPDADISALAFRPLSPT